MPPDSSQDSHLPAGVLYALVGGMGLLALLLVGLFTWTALTDDSDVLPYRWRAWVQNITGEGKVIKPQADDTPPPWVAAKAETPPADGSEATAALTPVEDAAAAADKAISAYRDSRDDQKLAIAAQQAIDAIRRVPVHVKGDAATQAAVAEVRDEKANARQHALEDARRVSRATHEVSGTRGDAGTPYLVLRAAAHPQARDVAHLNDGDRLHVFLATGSGWARVEVLTGPGTGQNGYVKDKHLRALIAADSGK